jgi:hypothetical protein
MRERAASFVEVSTPAWSFWRALLDTGVGLIVGTLYTFLSILVIGIVGEEALSSLYWQIDLDPLFRASMGAILLVGAVLAVVVPCVLMVERFAALRAAEASALAAPDAVPQRSLRMELKSAPATHLKTTGAVLFWCIAGLGSIYLLAVLFTEDLREDAVNWFALLVFAVLAAGAAALRGLGHRLVKRDATRMEALAGTWMRLVRRAEAADSERRTAAARAVVPRWLTTPGPRLLGRISAILMTATFVSLAAFVLSVFMRQQCRGCDPVYWDQPIETGIDVLSLSSGLAIAICAALGAVAWLAGVALQCAREVALARWVSDGTPRRVDVDLIEPLLSGNRSMVRLQLGLTALGAGGLILAIGAGWSDWPALDAAAVSSVSTAVIVLGLVVGWSDAPRRRRERQAVRDALFPGDGPRAVHGGSARSRTPRGSVPRP